MPKSTSLTAPAAVRMATMYPFWTELYYSMSVIEVNKDHELASQIQTLATDGRALWINTDFFKTLSLEQQVTALVHEVCHKMYLHCTRQGYRDAQLWNVAADYAINILLLKNSFKPIDGWLCEEKYFNMSAEAIYAELEKEAKKNGSDAAGAGQQKMPAKFADIRQFTGTPEEKDKEETEVKALVDRALASAQAMGCVPVGMEQPLMETYKAAKEPWYNALHRYMQSLSTSEYNWARLNRRTLRTHGIFAPLNQAEALGEVVIFIDTSGSCFERAQQSNFAGHLNAILSEAKPRRVHVYYFDTVVYPGEVIESGEFDVRLRPKGGGGTDFRPLFTQVDDDAYVPEVCIILTDLMGSFPAQEPEYPVIWASVYEHATAPFGTTMYVE